MSKIDDLLRQAYCMLDNATESKGNRVALVQRDKLPQIRATATRAKLYLDPTAPRHRGLEHFITYLLDVSDLIEAVQVKKYKSSKVHAVEEQMSLLDSTYRLAKQVVESFTIPEATKAYAYYMTDGDVDHDKSYVYALYTEVALDYAEKLIHHRDHRHSDHLTKAAEILSTINPDELEINKASLLHRKAELAATLRKKSVGAKQPRMPTRQKRKRGQSSPASPIAKKARKQRLVFKVDMRIVAEISARLSDASSSSTSSSPVPSSPNHSGSDSEASVSALVPEASTTAAREPSPIAYVQEPETIEAYTTRINGAIDMLGRMIHVSEGMLERWGDGSPADAQLNATIQEWAARRETCVAELASTTSSTVPTVRP